MLKPKKDKEKKVKLTKRSWQRATGLFSYLRPYALVYFIGWIFLVLSTSAGLIFPYLLGKLLGKEETPTNMGESIGALDLSNVNQVAFALFLLFGFQALFSFLRVVIFNNVTENALRDLRNDAFYRLIHMPMDFFNRNKVGALTSRISADVTQIQETLRTTIAEFFRQIIIVIGGTAFLVFISWKLSLIMLGTVPVMAIIAVIFGRYIKKLSKEAQDFTATSTGIVEEALTGISNVKAFTNELFLVNKFKDATQKTRDLNVKSGIWRGLFVSFIIFCLFGAIVFIIWQGLLMTQGNDAELSKEGFYQFILFTIMMGASVGSLPDLYASVQKSIGAIEKLFDLMEETNESQLSGMSIEKIEGNIELKEVEFYYPQRADMQVLKKVSFSIEPNSTLALVGSSGSGKSTIASLLLGYYDITGGHLTVNEKDIAILDKKSLRQHMAYVPQEVLLFSGTIEENILFGRPGASREEVVEAAKQANAWEFIERFSDGLHTEVGDRGIQLSGGQKQRIAIARAILKNPQILILDEATSALDSESEKLVQEALDRLMVGRTSVVIAHRLSTIRNADKIIVLQNGEILEQGKHHDLIEKGGLYADLVQLQSMQS
jgi:ABC-type multidrug transport system fused ATPase/permease subunit